MTDLATRNETQDFAEFYAAHFDRVARGLYAYLGDRTEAQDAAQEAFCRAYARWGRVGAYDDSLAWVRRVAWNTATSRPEMQLVHGGRFQMLCPGATGLENSGPKLNCSRRQLVEIGGSALPAPPLTGSLAKTVNGADGRIWLVDEGEMRVSSDRGHTWADVPQAPGDAWEQRPRISPDGREAWLEGNGKLLRLNSSGWQVVPGYPADFQGNGFWRQLDGWAPLGDGLVLLAYDDKLAFLKDGELTYVDSVFGGGISVLADGTVVVDPDNARTTIGIGQGMQREWITFS